MKKCWILLLMLCLLTGCAAAGTFETLGSVPQQSSAPPQPAQVLLELPEGAAVDVFGGEEQLYTCEGYTISLQTRQAGDLKTTVRGLCGYDLEQLSMMHSGVGEADRYDFVWTSSAEQGDLIGRCAVIDDGAYHYCLWVLAEAKDAGSLGEAWNQLFASFCLEAA